MLRKQTGKSISIRKTVSVMAFFLLAVAALLLIATSRISREYAHLNENMEDYKHWQKDVYDLQSGSDYLTEQARCFVVTGDRVYLDNYCREVNVDRRRENAVEEVRRLMGETEAYASLVKAMEASTDLMDRERYAMRLAIAGFGLEFSAFPSEVRDVELSDVDLARSPQNQRETACLLVCDAVYNGKKQAIASSIRECAVDGQIEKSQLRAAAEMKKTILQQRIMIGASIAALTGILLLFMQMVVCPLLKAVNYIRKGQPIPVEGSEEFRFLAREYNAAHQTNVNQMQELAYEATHDNLTGVYSRNGYESIRQSVDWSKCALVLFDLDQFKRVNDGYGHKMGDRVLARTARVIQNAFRAQDSVCRIGGDEFAVIMVSVSTDLEDIICNKVRHINEELSHPEDGIPGIRISSGAACGAMFPDFETLFQEADSALYRIKNQGGGSCEVVKG